MYRRVEVLKKRWLWLQSYSVDTVRLVNARYSPEGFEIGAYAQFRHATNTSPPPVV